MKLLRTQTKEGDCPLPERSASLRNRCPHCGDMLLEAGQGNRKCRRCQFRVCVECEGSMECED